MAAFAIGPGRRDRLAMLLGLAVLLPLAGLDFLAGTQVAITTAYAIPPLVAAYAAGLWGVSVVGLVSLGVAAASPAWNGGFDDGYAIRVLVVVAGCAIGLLTAWNGVKSRAAELRLRLLDAVSSVGGGEAAPVSEVLAQIVEALVPEAGDFCMIDVISGGTANRVAARARGDESANRVERWLQAREPSIPPHILEAGDGQVPEPSLRSPMDEQAISEIVRNDEERELLREIRVRSTIVVPLVARGRALGALTLVTAWSGRTYGTEDVRFAQVLATRVALALDNAGLFSDLESVERRLEAVMLSLGEAVMVYDDLGSVAYANPAAARWLGYADQHELISSDAAEVRDRFRVFDEAGEEIDDPVTELARPRHLGGRLLLRVLTTSDRNERWARFTVEPISGNAGGPLYAVMAIEDLTEVKRAEIAQRLLAETGEILSDPDDESALRRVAEVAVPEFSDWCVVSIPEGNQHRIRAIAARSAERQGIAEELATTYPGTLQGPLAQVLETGQAELIEIGEETLEGLARDSGHLELLRSAKARSAILSPVTTGSKVLGAISFINASDSRRFDADDLAVAVEIGRRAGQAVENARLTGEIAAVAATLQMELMPSKLITIPGWRLRTMYRPAGEVSYVGGDFYDAFEVPDGWVIVMGDVVGRGPAAASLTAVARDTLRSVATLSGNPVEALETLDRVLRMRERPGICSAVVLRLPQILADAVAVQVTSAGHPLPLRISGAEAVSEVGAFGPLLGAFEGSSWESVEVPLERGDQLVLYTDGVTESKRPAGDRFGEERLLSELRGVDGPDAVIERVEQALARFGATQGLDDVATLAIGLEGIDRGRAEANGQKKARAGIQRAPHGG